MLYKSQKSFNFFKKFWLVMPIVLPVFLTCVAVEVIAPSIIKGGFFLGFNKTAIFSKGDVLHMQVIKPFFKNIGSKVFDFNPSNKLVKNFSQPSFGFKLLAEAQEPFGRPIAEEPANEDTQKSIENRMCKQFTHCLYETMWKFDKSQDYPIWMKVICFIFGIIVPAVLFWYFLDSVVAPYFLE